MKTILATIAFLFIINFAEAQKPNAPFYGFRLGLTAHPTFGFIKADNNGKSNGTNLGFSYGLMTDFNFAPHYSLNTGLTVTTINGKNTEIDVSPYHDLVSTTYPIAYDLKYKMRYIEIPIVVKLKTDKINQIRWYGQFGLSNDFKIGAKQDAKSGKTILADDVDSSEWTRFYRAGIIIGGGGEYDIAEHTSLVAGISLNNGFTDITNAKNTVRNHFVSLNLGVFF